MLLAAGGPWHRMAEETFDGVQLLWIFSGDKTGGPTGRLHSSRPSDSMDIVLRAIRQIEVDDVTNVGDIDASSGNVRRHEHAKDTTLKAIQCTSTLRKTSIAMEDAYSVSRTAEHTSHMIRPMLGPGEDEDGLLLVLQ